MADNDFTRDIARNLTLDLSGTAAMAAALRSSIGSGELTDEQTQALLHRIESDIDDARAAIDELTRTQ
jgi:hypothetical protein